LHRQVLDGNRLVLADDPRRKLMVERAACVGDPRVYAGDLQSGLVPVAGALPLAGVVPLRLAQALLGPAQET
jgi:hypothetical protein